MSVVWRMFNCAQGSSRSGAGTGSTASGWEARESATKTLYRRTWSSHIFAWNAAAYRILRSWSHRPARCYRPWGCEVMDAVNVHNSRAPVADCTAHAGPANKVRCAKIGRVALARRPGLIGGGRPKHFLPARRVRITPGTLKQTRSHPSTSSFVDLHLKAIYLLGFSIDSHTQHELPPALVASTMAPRRAAAAPAKKTSSQKADTEGRVSKALPIRPTEAKKKAETKKELTAKRSSTGSAATAPKSGPSRAAAKGPKETATTNGTEPKAATRGRKESKAAASSAAQEGSLIAVV